MNIRPDPTPGERVGLFTVLHPVWTVLGWVAFAASALWLTWWWTR